MNIDLAVLNLTGSYSNWRHFGQLRKLLVNQVVEQSVLCFAVSLKRSLILPCFFLSVGCCCWSNRTKTVAIICFEFLGGGRGCSTSCRRRVPDGATERAPFTWFCFPFVTCPFLSHCPCLLFFCLALLLPSFTEFLYKNKVTSPSSSVTLYRLFISKFLVFYHVVSVFFLAQPG